MVWKFFSNPIICLDGDESGQRAAIRIAEKLFSVINETLTNNMKIFLPLYFGFASFLWFLILSKIITTNYLSKLWMGNIVVINKLIGLILVTISLLIFLNIFI